MGHIEVVFDASEAGGLGLDSGVVTGGDRSCSKSRWIGSKKFLHHFF